jgi:hypothetical protein
MTHLIQTLKLECFFGHQRVNNILKLRLYQSVSLSAQCWKECAKQFNGDNHFFMRIYAISSSDIRQ